ncbi:hypothetical protein BD414DRAFT_505084 [Trametes punicea]|nr:hypothetical protein BD414DRAFT_505084 [Trametes punicea]
MSNARAPIALNIPRAQPRADGLFGGLGGGGGVGGILGGGDPLSILLPTVTLGLPPPRGTSTSADTTSSTSVISLTSSDTSATATSTSSDATSTSSSAATSDTSSSTSDTQTSTSAQPTATGSTTPTPTPTPTPAPTSTSSPSPTTDTSLSLSSSISSSSSSASPSATLASSSAPKGFLQNKALSVGVITAASLVGLVVIIAIATWAIRKRRNDRLHQDILDFSTANLVGDTEKGGGAAGTDGGRRDMFADGSSTHGSGSSSGHGGYTRPQPQVQTGGMYDNAVYPAASAFVPKPAPTMPVNPYSAQPAYVDPSYAFPTQEQNNTYANWNYGYGAAAMVQPQNAYEQAYGGMDDAYGGIAAADPQQSVAMAGIGTGVQGQGPQRRPSAHRKPPPQLYIPPTTSQVVGASPTSTVSITKPPLQPAPGLGAAQPARRTSLLSSPPAGSTESGSKRDRRDTLTHVELLDPSAPRVPATSPTLPDEFGVSSPPPPSKDSPVEQPVRRLVVRNE